MGFLSDEELATLIPSELVGEPTPIPTQIVSSDEYFPAAQNAKQREVEARLLDMGDRLAKRQGVSRRRFFQTASGMAAAFVAMNQTYGNLFAATTAEAATPELADARASGLKHQFIMDMHTHFLRDDTRLTGFVNMRQAVGKAGWNPELAGKPQTIEDLKFDNYFKEIYLDSDTKVALISSAPSDIVQDWFLTNEMMAATRDKVNAKAGSKRMFAHAIFTPGQPGWMEAIDHAISLGPIRSKDIRSATTHIRTVATIRGGWTTRSWCIPRIKRCSTPASAMSVCTKACSRRRLIAGSPTCAAMPMSATSGRRRATGRS